MAMNSASDALVSVGGMMQKPVVHTKDQKLPADKADSGNFQDAIKQELNKPSETQQPKDDTTEELPKAEKPNTEVAQQVGDEVLEEAAAMVQNPILALFDQDMLTNMFRQDAVVKQVAAEEISMEAVQPQMIVDTQQTTKLPEAKIMQTTNEMAEVTSNTQETKQEVAGLASVKNQGKEQEQVQKQQQQPVQVTNEKQLQVVKKEQPVQQPVKQELENAEVFSKTQEVQKPVEPMMLQTKQKTETGEVVHVKVADVLPVNKGNVAQQLADKILLHNSNEFELQLHPQSLGKIQIKVQFDNGATKVSIFCENAKAMHLLSENTSSLATMLENRTGNQTTIQVQENKDTFYKQETDPNGHQQQQQTKDEQQQRQQKQKHQDSMDFLQQMRLGLV